MMSIEQEVKLRFDTPEAARQAVMTAGGRLVVSRRLLVDTLYDTEDERLRRSGCAVRLRRDGPAGVITFKGRVQPGPVKSREEIETTVAEVDAAERILERLGFRAWFHAEKYREEFEAPGVHVSVDEAPVGTFVEIEGPPDAIERFATLIDRTTSDYCLQSYPALYFGWCQANGVTAGDMTFDFCSRVIKSKLPAS
jgi:adenylate cyclase, class 2